MSEPMNIRERLSGEIDQLSDAHAEQVLHHVRTLREVPDSSEITESGESHDTQLDIGQAGVNLVWWCMRCDSEFPRPMDNPEKCPNCGAGSEELVLREPNIERAA